MKNIFELIMFPIAIILMIPLLVVGLILWQIKAIVKPLEFEGIKKE